MALSPQSPQSPSPAPPNPNSPKPAPSATARPAPVIFCDAVQTLGVHNGVVRISFIRLDSEGKPAPALDLLLPVGQAEHFVRALHNIGRQNAPPPPQN